jgi:hypothetical protein
MISHQTWKWLRARGNYKTISRCSWHQSHASNARERDIEQMTAGKEGLMNREYASLLNRKTDVEMEYIVDSNTKSKKTSRSHHGVLFRLMMNWMPRTFGWLTRVRLPAKFFIVQIMLWSFLWNEHRKPQDTLADFLDPLQILLSAYTHIGLYCGLSR